jgi:hypothetical protein
MFRLIIPALRAAGFWVDTYFCFGNWYLDVAGRTYETYFAGLPSKLRNTIVRARKKLEKAGAWSIEIHTEAGSGLTGAIADFEKVYGQSWKHEEPFPDFIGGLCRTAATNGWLRLGVLKLAGEPIASQLWLTKDGHALIYKLAYVEAYKGLSAGSVLSAALMQHAIEVDHAHEIDYLTGDDAYKRDWMSHRRERLGIIAFNPLTLRGLAGSARHFGGKLRAGFVGRVRKRTAQANPADAGSGNQTGNDAA